MKRDWSDVVYVQLCYQLELLYMGWRMNYVRIHVIRSPTCAAGALHLFMDMLNDDSAIVRLQALQTMHHMAVLGHLKVQEMHMYM
nr:hypothetical protein [Tanacetum cinerariifolium]